MDLFLGIVEAIGAALSWSASAAFYKIGSRGISSGSANLARSIPSVAFLVLFTVATGVFTELWTVESSAFLAIFASAVLGLVFGDTLYIYSIRAIGVSRAVPIAASYPLFVAFTAVILLGESMTTILLIGTVSIVVGLWLLTSKIGKEILPIGENFLRGAMAALGTALLWSASIIGMSMALLSTSPVIVSTLRVLMLSMMLGTYFAATDRSSIKRIRRQNWLAMSLGGVIALGIGWTLFAFSVNEIGAARAVPISSLSPFFSTLIGTTLLRESRGLKLYLGSALVVVGTMLVSS